MGVPGPEQKSDQITHVPNIIIIGCKFLCYSSDSYAYVCVTGTHTSIYK